MTEYEFVFPDGKKVAASPGPKIEGYDVVRVGSELFRIEWIDDSEDVVAHSTEPGRIELASLPRGAPVVGRIHDLTNSRSNSRSTR